MDTDPSQPEPGTVNMEAYARLQQAAVGLAYDEAIQLRVKLERAYNEMLNLAVAAGVEKDMVTQERETMRALLATLAGWDRDLRYHWEDR